MTVLDNGKRPIQIQRIDYYEGEPLAWKGREYYAIVHGPITCGAGTGATREQAIHRACCNLRRFQDQYGK